MKMIKIDVDGMMSERDVNKINKAVEAIHGIKMCDAVLKENAVYIIIEDDLNIENIKIFRTEKILLFIYIFPMTYS